MQPEGRALVVAADLEAAEPRDCLLAVPFHVHLVDDASEIDEAWLEGVSTVGLTSGASVPETLVEQVMGWLAERGYGEVTEVESAQEHLLFALPPELRRDLRKAGISES